MSRTFCAAANIGSASSYLSVPQGSAYSASKFAVRAYSDALRIELAPFGVHVMHVAPGEPTGRTPWQQAQCAAPSPWPGLALLQLDMSKCLQRFMYDVMQHFTLSARSCIV